MNKNIKFSMVLCTLGRNDYVKNFLNTISMQQKNNFEIILVDQNDDDALSVLIKNYSNLNIKYLKSRKGLSIGRNVGLKHVRGEYVSFPDDDCEYPKDILKNIESLFSEKKYDLISMQSKWKDMLMSNGNFDLESGVIDKYNVFKRVISYTFFVKKSVIKNIFFDEYLGVGAKSIFQSGEEVDFVLRILSQKVSTFYSNKLFIFHPHSTSNFYDLKLRTEKYVPGKSYVLRKHNYPKWYIYAFIVFPILRIPISILRLRKNDVTLNFISFIYRLKGYIQSKKYEKSNV